MSDAPRGGEARDGEADAPSLLHAALEAGDGVALDATHPERAVLAIEGDVRVGGRSIESGQLAVIERGARPSIEGTGRVMVSL